MDLKQAKAVVTGGASGLGLAVAKRLHGLGARVAVLDVREDAGRIVQSELGGNVLFVPADVASESSVERAIKKIADRFSGITLAVNSAGIVQSRRVLGRSGPLPQADFAAVIEVNLIGTFTVCREAACTMQHNRLNKHGERGVIINTASIAAYEGQIGQSAYAASKGGVVSLTLPLAREFARFGIRVVAVAPGLFKTPLFDTLSEPAKEHLIQSIPFPHRLGQPDEFADLVCAIYQNPMLNGEVIRLDGALRLPLR